MKPNGLKREFKKFARNDHVAQASGPLIKAGWSISRCAICPDALCFRNPTEHSKPVRRARIRLFVVYRCTQRARCPLAPQAGCLCYAPANGKNSSRTILPFFTV